MFGAWDDYFHNVNETEKTKGSFIKIICCNRVLTEETWTAKRECCASLERRLNDHEWCHWWSGKLLVWDDVADEWYGGSMGIEDGFWWEM